LTTTTSPVRLEVEKRRRLYGIPIAALADRAAVSYPKLYRALVPPDLSPDELTRLQGALDAMEGERRASAEAV
jgi:hypothetical protein